MANKKRRRKPPARRGTTPDAASREHRGAARGADTPERRAHKEAARRRREQELKRKRRRQFRSRILTVTAVVFVGLVAIRFLGRTNSPGTPAVYVSPSASPVDPATLPGMQDHAAPWANGANGQLGARISAVGLPPEGTTLHTHQHLDVFVNGRAVPVPGGIGLGSVGSPLHTHDDSGIIHVEASTTGPFTLGQFFDVWGVRLTSDCLGGSCGEGVKVYVDGHLATGDPRQIRLVNHQEIAVVYGTQPSTRPSSYRFPALL
jgi:hypothetical protein